MQNFTQRNGGDIEVADAIEMEANHLRGPCLDGASKRHNIEDLWAEKEEKEVDEGKKTPRDESITNLT